MSRCKEINSSIESIDMKTFNFKPQLIVYDFDGVMTDNRAIVDETGKEYVCVNRGDGYGVSMIKSQLHISQIILSTEENPVVVRRAEKLKIQVIHNAGEKKRDILRDFCAENNFDLAKIMYIGNDLNDYEAMKICGFCACPADAEPEIRAVVNYVFDAKGGGGVVRELFRLLSENDDDEQRHT